MDLRHLTDRALLSDTRILVSKERELTAKILHHLREIDRRKLYSDLGYTSLFDYCLKDLGYSDSAAYRRIQSARMLEALPQIEEKIESGNLTLTNLSMVDQFFKQNDIQDKETKLEILEKVENKSKKECENELFKLSGKEAPPIKDKKKRLSQDKVRLSLTLSDTTMEIVDKVKSLTHQKLDLDGLIHFMAKTTITVLEKQKFKLTSSQGSLPPANVNRVISAGVKRAVYLRDKKCTKCGSTHRLQYDHRKPYALGGKSDEKNVRILCFNCNQRARIRAKL